MRVPDPSPRCPARVVAALALLLAAAGPLAAQAPQDAPGTAPLGAFDRFELADVVLADALAGVDGHERVRRQLDMHLRDALDGWLAERNRRPARGTPPRTLRIEPTIVALSTVGPAVRMAVGPFVGNERLHVRVRFVDAATGEAVAETELRAGGSMLVNVSSLGAGTPALPRRIAADLAAHLDAAVAAAPSPEPRLPH